MSRGAGGGGGDGGGDGVVMFTARACMSSHVVSGVNTRRTPAGTHTAELLYKQTIVGHCQQSTAHPSP